MKKIEKPPFDVPIPPNPNAIPAKGPIDLKKVRGQLKKAQNKQNFWR